MKHDVFLALARPAMVWGVTQSYLIAIGTMNLMCFVLDPHWIWGVCFLFCYLIGRIGCAIEARWPDLAVGYLGFRIKNRSLLDSNKHYYDAS